MALNGRARTGLLLALGVAAITFVLYLPALRNGFTNWDDQVYVIEDAAIRSLAPAALLDQAKAVRVGIWAPLTTLSYAIDYHFWKLDPFGYHLTNVLLHAASAGTLALILLTLGAPAAGAALGAALFAFHPAQVESVAWIAQRKAALSMCFMLLSFLAYARATRVSPPSGRGLLAAFVLFAAALLSKVTVVVFPAVLLLYDLGFRRERWPGLLLEKVPFLAAGFAVALVGYRFQAELGVVTEGWMGGTPALHAATTAGLFARYARILLFPVNLSALYDPPDAVSLAGPWALAGYAVLALGAVGMVHAWRRDRRALWWMGLFWLGFLPVAQFVTYAVHMADRYLYVPSVGIAAGAGLGIAALLDRLRPAPARAVGWASVLALLACLTLLTGARERVWRDPIALWSETVTRPPVHWSAYFNYGKTLADEGKTLEAIPIYERALDRRPDEIKVLVNLGNALARTGELGRAETLLRRAALLPQGGPAFRAQAADNLGIILRMRERDAAALSAFQEAARLAPRDPVPRVHLGETLRALGRAPEARMRFEQALALDPASVEAAIGLAGLDRDAGRNARARARLDSVLARNPDRPDALLERARLLAAEGDTAAARADLDRALDQAPPGGLRKRIQEAREELSGAPKGGR